MVSRITASSIVDIAAITDPPNDDHLITDAENDAIIAGANPEISRQFPFQWFGAADGRSAGEPSKHISNALLNWQRHLLELRKRGRSNIDLRHRSI
jgi:hypothetical protein